jgi:hypothetical protein
VQALDPLERWRPGSRLSGNGPGPGLHLPSGGVEVVLPPRRTSPRPFLTTDAGQDGVVTVPVVAPARPHAVLRVHMSPHFFVRDPRGPKNGLPRVMDLQFGSILVARDA